MLDFVWDDCKKNKIIYQVNSESVFDSNPEYRNLTRPPISIQNSVFELGKLILYVDSVNPSQFVKDCFQNAKYSHSKLKPYKERIKKRLFRKVKESNLVFLLLEKCLETRPKEKVDFRFLKSFLLDIKKAFKNVYRKAFSYYRNQHKKAEKNCQKSHSIFQIDNEFSFKRKEAQGIAIAPLEGNPEDAQKKTVSRNVFRDKESTLMKRPRKNLENPITGDITTQMKSSEMGEPQPEPPSSQSLSRIESISSNCIKQQLPDSQMSDLHSRSNVTCGKSNYSSNSTTSAQYPKSSRTFIHRRASYKKLPKLNASISPEIRSYIHRNCLRKKNLNKMAVDSKIVSRLVSRLDCIKKSCSQTSSNLSSSSLSPSHVSSSKSGASTTRIRVNKGLIKSRNIQNKLNQRYYGQKGHLSGIKKPTRSQPGSRRVIQTQTRNVFK